MSEQLDMFSAPLVVHHAPDPTRTRSQILWDVCVHGQWGRAVAGRRSIMIWCPVERGGDRYQIGQIRETLDVAIDTTPEMAIPLIEALDWNRNPATEGFREEIDALRSQRAAEAPRC